MWEAFSKKLASCYHLLVVFSFFFRNRSLLLSLTIQDSISFCKTLLGKVAIHLVGKGGEQGHHLLLTLKWCRWRLSHVYMLLIDQINWLVLGNLHTCAYITFPMKKECESTGQMLTKIEKMRNSALHFRRKQVLETGTTDVTQLYFITIQQSLPLMILISTNF